MHDKSYGAWLAAGFDLWRLGAKASMVMTLRIARIAAGGPNGTAEAGLIVSEKVRAALEFQTRLMTVDMGVTPLSGTQEALKHYRGKVAANKRRLSRRKAGPTC